MSALTLARGRNAFSTQRMILNLTLVLFLLLCVVPVLYMLIISFLTSEGGLTLENYGRIITDPRRRNLLFTSTVLALGTAMLSTMLGAPLGLLLARTDLPVKRFLRFVLVFPLTVPPYVIALAWIYATGPAGFVARIVGRDLFSGWTYSLSGAILVLALSLFPLPMLATEAAARRVDGHLEEAGLLYAPPRAVLWKITLPLLVPMVAAAALITFVLALAEFGVPALLQVRVFTTEVFTAFAALYNFGAATALSVPLLVLALVAAVGTTVLTGDRLLVTRRSLHRGLAVSLGRGRPLALFAVFLLVFLAVGFPLLTFAYQAGSLERIFTSVQHSGDAIGNSFLLATAGATVATLLGVLLGYIRARSTASSARLFDLLLIVIFAVPSTVVGVGLIGLWNRPGLPVDVYGTDIVVVFAYLARFLPVTALILAAGIRQLPASFEEAAEVAGASWLRTFRRILLPQMGSGLVAAWVVAFIFIFGELGATILVLPPGESTLPVRIYTIVANAPPSQVAALALLQATVTLGALAVLAIALSTTRRR